MPTFWNCLLIAAGIIVGIIIITNVWIWIEEDAPFWVQQTVYCIIVIFILAAAIYALRFTVFKFLFI